MATAAHALTLLVAALHLGFMVLETVGWSRMGRRLGMSPSDIEGSRLLAANQGIYNGAVAMTLLWALSSGNDAAVLAMLVFVVVVGVFGGVTVSASILVVQALPAVLALVLRLLG
jgi:putative membrane protein